jgi:hypothetical protein
MDPDGARARGARLGQRDQVRALAAPALDLDAVGDEAGELAAAMTAAGAAVLAGCPPARPRRLALHRSVPPRSGSETKLKTTFNFLGAR